MNHKIVWLVAAVVLASSHPVSSAQSGKTTWLFARPSDGAVITTLKEVAEDFKAQIDPTFELQLESTPDRPSYLEKLKTLTSVGGLPAMFDTDATAFAEKMKERGGMLDVGAMLKNLGVYDSFRSIALQYQMFSDGSLSLLPLEFHLEFFWYNRAMFERLNLQPPQTIPQLIEVCKTLRQNGVTPIAVDGTDQWPLLRYLAFVPFRLSGNDYIFKLKRAQASFADPIGMQAAEFVYTLGQIKAFQEGFASMGYVEARDLFTSGQAAMYYMGTWELGTFTSDALPADIKANIAYFTLPMLDDASTAPNEFFVNSGIGMAFNPKKFDDRMQKFVEFLLKEYPKRYAAKEQFPPIKVELPPDAQVSDLYKQVTNEINGYGSKFGFPWDTQFDPVTNDRIGKELVRLASNEITPAEFAATMDAVLKAVAPTYFKE